MNLFEKAQAIINRSVIESFLSGGTWQGDEYWVSNPLRDDKNPDSFSINGRTGVFNDFATGDKGNLISLLAKLKGIDSKEAAKLIIQTAGYDLADVNSSFKKKESKDPPEVNLDELFIPIPKEKIDLFRSQISARFKWLATKGKIKDAIYSYYNEKRELIFCIVRWKELNKKGEWKKTFSPLFLKRNGKLFSKNLLNNMRPLYHLPEIIERPDLPVLIVEGEKCANIKVDGYILCTWSNGAESILRTNWQPLADREVIFWPDNDEAGYKTIEKIKELLPHVKVLRMPINKEKGWDLADAIEEDPDFSAHLYIEEHLKADPRTHVPLPNRAPSTSIYDSNFVPLGFTDDAYIFYLRKIKRIMHLNKTRITGQHLLQLEDFNWWQAYGFTDGKRETLLVTAVINYLKPLIEDKGLFSYPYHMGMGFHRIRDIFLWHTGSVLHDNHGHTHQLEAFLPNHIFIAEKSSSYPFYEYTEQHVSAESRQTIMEYFYARRWAFDVSNFSAKLMLGWALWSPFCGFWSWRPHLHLTASAGTGKSTFIDYSIAPLIAPYGLRYNNLTTAPAIRQAINRKPRPVILEEFEVSGNENDRTNTNIENILELAKSASDDNSTKTIKGTPNVDSNGEQTPREFDIKASFLFVSVREPVLNSALSQRIINIEMAKPPTIDAKYLELERRASAFLKTDGKKIIAHNFRNLPYLLDESRKFAKALSMFKVEPRQAQNYAPLLTFVHFLEFGTSTSIVTLACDYAELILSFKDHLSKENIMSDAEKCLDKILQADIISENNERKSASKIITQILSNDTSEYPTALHNHLGRGGMAIYKKNNILYLAVHTNSDAIRLMLRNSSYASSYASILRRHESCADPNTRTEKIKSVAGLKPTFILLELKNIIDEDLVDDKK